MSLKLCSFPPSRPSLQISGFTGRSIHSAPSLQRAPTSFTRCVCVCVYLKKKNNKFLQGCRVFSSAPPWVHTTWVTSYNSADVISEHPRYRCRICASGCLYSKVYNVFCFKLLLNRLWVLFTSPGTDSWSTQLVFIGVKSQIRTF